jgi:hypothetical protein
MNIDRPLIIGKQKDDSPSGEATPTVKIEPVFK